MKRYSQDMIQDVRRLRALGNTYGEINTNLKLKIPKSTLHEWCKNTSLPSEYRQKIASLNTNNLNKGRLIALEVNKIKREKYLQSIKDKNSSLAKAIGIPVTAKIALAMLCLGEASKYSKTRKCFSLGSSDPRIITIFLELLKRHYGFNLEKVRCTVQCRADQDIKELERFWMDIANVPKRLFYKARIDLRTLGKPTLKTTYKGVLRVDYFDTNVQLELESLADLVYNRLRPKGPVAQW